MKNYDDKFYNVDTPSIEVSGARRRVASCTDVTNTDHILKRIEQHQIRAKKKTLNKINYFYMDDLIVRSFSNNIGIDFEVNKCAKVTSVRYRFYHQRTQPMRNL